MEAGRDTGSTKTVAKVLAVVIAVGALAVAATTGDSWAVRLTWCWWPATSGCACGAGDVRFAACPRTRRSRPATPAWGNPARP